jgi:hypothetical protein
MQFQIDFREFNGHNPSKSGFCAVSSNVASLPSWVQHDMSKWKDGDKFSVLVKKFVDGKSVYVEKTFELKMIDKQEGPY